MNLARPTRPLLALAALLTTSLLASAQDAASALAGKLYLKDGKEINWSDVTMTGTNLAWKTKHPVSGAVTMQNIALANVSRLDFPSPPELEAALLALSRNDPEKANQLAAPVVAKFKAFMATPGSWYPAASMIQLEGLALKKDPAFETLRADLKTINLSSTDQARLATIDAVSDYHKGILGPAIASVDKLIKATEDASVLAKLYLLKGDIQFKRGNFPDALESYLHLPVFYGAQAAYLANAEIGAARSLQKMGRLPDALEMLRAIAERYKDTPQGTDAETEMKTMSQALGTAADSEALRKDDTDAPPADAPK